MSIVAVREKPIHYEVVGKGESILFIHSFVGSWRYWWPTMKAMSEKGYRAFALDLWGFGDSFKNREDYSLNQYADMLIDLIARAGVGMPVTLVGHGLGAAAALRLASKYPQDIHQVIALGLPIGPNALNSILQEKGPAEVLTEYPSLSFPETEREIKKTDPVAFKRAAEEISRTDLAKEVAQCRAALTLVYAENDPLIKAPDLPVLPAPTGMLGRPIFRFGEGHFPMLPDPNPFVQFILDHS